MKRTAWRRSLLIAGLACAYFAAGRLGLGYFGLLHPSASPVWMPTGIAIAGLLLSGYSLWPAVFVGAFLVNVTTAGSAVTSLGVATGNTLEALLAVYLVNRFARGVAVFGRAPDIFRFAGIALLSTMVSATIGVGALALGGYAAFERFGAIWLTWWLGDVAGAIVVTPLIVLWWADHRFHGGRGRTVEALLLLTAVVLTGGVIFLAPILQAYPLAFLCVPVLVWAAFRFGQREIASAVGLMSAIAIVSTVQGNGPFALETANESLLVLQAFMGVTAITAMTMGALSTERARLLAAERAARAEAEEANRSKDRFLAILSHELRNPLSAIGSAVGVLDQLQESAPETARWRTIVRRQTDHLSRLIDDLLDIARVSAGKIHIERSPVELGEIVERSVHALTSGDGETKARVELSTENVWISGDADRIEQIVGNLLGNALKHTPSDGRIRVSVAPSGDQRVLLQVEDDGAGIESHLLERIFEPFVQGEQGIARPSGGLGIGLALVKRLVDLHGGRVRAASAGAGQGSVFTVELPRLERPVLFGLERLEERAARARSPRVLLVEDNDDARDAMLELLRLCGYEAHEAADGQIGLDAALTLRPDVVLLDIGLPQLDGYTVAHRLKGADPAIRLIALTGYAGDTDNERYRQACFDAHLLKPIDIKRLRAVIDDLLDRSTDPPSRAHADSPQRETITNPA